MGYSRIGEIQGNNYSVINNKYYRHYRKAVGALLVYDLTKHKTFENIKKWHEEILELTEEKLVIILIGNKLDLLHK